MQFRQDTWVKRNTCICDNFIIIIIFKIILLVLFYIQGPLLFRDQIAITRAYLIQVLSKAH